MIELSKEDKKKMKSFELSNREEFEIYLQEIIVRTYRCIEKERKYLTRLSDYIQKIITKNSDKNIKEIKVKYDDYSEFVDLLSNTQCYILNLIGDCQNSSISYFKFRDLIFKKKKRGILNFEMRELDKEIIYYLSELNKMRNWSNHVPESLLVSQMKLIEQGELERNGRNPIIINKHNYCTLEYIQDLYNTSYNFHKMVQKVHQSMKKDYACLIGESMRIVQKYIDEPVDLDYSLASKMSSEIQGINGTLLMEDYK